MYATIAGRETSATNVNLPSVLASNNCYLLSLPPSKRPGTYTAISSRNTRIQQMASHKHLARLDGIWTDTPVFYVTVCTLDRRPALANDVLHSICCEVWSNCETQYGWRVGRYVLMPDHVHFFCWPLRTITPVAGLSEAGDTNRQILHTGGLEEATYKKQLSTLSTFVGKWKEWTSKYAHRRHGIVLPLWQPEFLTTSFVHGKATKISGITCKKTHYERV